MSLEPMHTSVPSGTLMHPAVWPQTTADYGDFSIFQDGGRHHLGFLKFQILG